jgi:hypothetical protein
VFEKKEEYARALCPCPCGTWCTRAVKAEQGGVIEDAVERGGALHPVVTVEKVGVQTAVHALAGSSSAEAATPAHL